MKSDSDYNLRKVIVLSICSSLIFSITLLFDILINPFFGRYKEKLNDYFRNKFRNKTIDTIKLKYQKYYEAHRCYLSQLRDYVKQVNQLSQRDKEIINFDKSFRAVPDKQKANYLSSYVFQLKEEEREHFLIYWGVYINDLKRHFEI